MRECCSYCCIICYDLVIISNNGRWIEEFKKEMIKRYEMNDIGLVHHFLGIKVYQDDRGVFIYQKDCHDPILRSMTDT